MQKYSVMIGEDKDGKLDVICVGDFDTLRKQLEQITLDGGKVGSGKSVKQFVDVDLLHCQKGRMKTRRGLGL